MKWSHKKFIEVLKKNKFILAILLIGAVLLILPTGGGADAKKTQATEPASDVTVPSFSLEEIEKKLSDAISAIHGAGDVKVVLTLKSSVEKQLAQDEKSAVKAGGEASQESSTVVISTGSGTQETVTKKYLYPEFQGALVVCEGGDNAEIKLKVTQAVGALTGLGSDKISVIK